MLSKSAQKSFESWRAQAQGLTWLDAFEPNAGTQELAIRSKAHQVWMFAGNKWGKSLLLVIKLAYRTLPELDKDGNRTGYLLDPYVRSRIPTGGVKAWVSTYSQSVQRETIQPEFDMIFEPYIKGQAHYAEKGTRFWTETPAGVIHFKWQTAEKKSYEGANIHFAALDEPHDEAIYNEITMRFAKTQGYLWVGATLVINPEDPDIWKKLRYVEWMANRATLWEADHEEFPLLEVYYGDISENPHVNTEFQLGMMAGMSDAEKLTRRTGRVHSLFGLSAFNEDELNTITNHLITNKERYEAEFGTLQFLGDAEDSEVVFSRTANEFPDYPKSGFIVKVWERPVANALFIRPEYFIGVDIAEGISGGNYTCAYVMRGDTGYIVACLHGLLDEIELAKQLYLLGMYYCDRFNNPAMCAIEVNISVGKTTQSYMITGHAELGIPRYGIHRLYHRQLESDMERGVLLLGRMPGWLTSNKTRGYLITAVRQVFIEAYKAITSDSPCPIPDSALPFEGKRFVADKTGKYQAAPGYFDDRVLAIGITKKCKDQYYRKPKALSGDAGVDHTDDDTWYLKDGQIILNIEGIERRKRRSKKIPAEEMVY